MCGQVTVEAIDCFFLERRQARRRIYQWYDDGSVRKGSSGFREHGHRLLGGGVDASGAVVKAES